MLPCPTFSRSRIQFLEISIFSGSCSFNSSFNFSISPGTSEIQFITNYSVFISCYIKKYITYLQLKYWTRLFHSDYKKERSNRKNIIKLLPFIIYYMSSFPFVRRLHKKAITIMSNAMISSDTTLPRVAPMMVISCEYVCGEEVPVV